MMLLRIKTSVLAISICAFSSPGLAKICDPDPIHQGGIRYQSHANYIEAIDSLTNKPKWRTELYGTIEPFISSPFIEQDAQWNIITSFEIQGDTIFVRDGDGNQYLVNMATGKQISTPNIQAKHHLRWGVVLSLLSFLGILAFWIVRIFKSKNQQKHGQF